MDDFLKFPFQIRLAITLIIILAMIGLLYLGRDILLPLSLAVLFAVLLRPATAYLTNNWHIPSVISIIIIIVISVAVIAGLIYFLSMQIASMADDWGRIKSNVNIHLHSLQNIIYENLGLTRREQNDLLDNAKESSMSNSKDVVGATLNTFTDIMLNLTLIPIYTFLLLLYRVHFMKFLAKVVARKNHLILEDILRSVKVSVQSYIMGLLIEMVIVTVLTSAGLYFIGVEYYILLGVITGILNLIPYVGILVAMILSIVASMTGSTDLSIVIGVIVVNILVQLIDNNLLVPMIVSSKVQINALVSIVGIIIGGALGGVSGMFVAIPFIAILKVVFDRIEYLKPWGYLLGDDIPKTYRWRNLNIPVYHYENSQSGPYIETEMESSTFTETTTDNPTDSADVNNNISR